MSPQITCMKRCLLLSQTGSGYICWSFLHCMFSNVSSSCLPERMYSNRGYICLTFSHCVCSHMSPHIAWREDAKSHCLHLFDFFHCVFWRDSSKCLPERMHNCIGCVCATLLHCVFSNASPNHLLERMQIHTACICEIFLRCVLTHVFLNCSRGCKVTLVAFVRIFSTMCF